MAVRRMKGAWNWNCAEGRMVRNPGLLSPPSPSSFVIPVQRATSSFPLPPSSCQSPVRSSSSQKVRPASSISAARG
jgi:hypothetical protein